ncbi:MAG: hypothetical protein ACHP6I_01040 [Rickettsiales bacterium]
MLETLRSHILNGLADSFKRDLDSVTDKQSLLRQPAEGESLLHYAIRMNRSNIACVVLEKSTDIAELIAIRDSVGRTPFEMAVRSNCASVVEKILITVPKPIDLLTKPFVGGDSALYTTILDGKSNLTDYFLIAAGPYKINLFEQRNNLGVTPLNILSTTEFARVFNLPVRTNENIINSVRSHFNFFGLKSTWQSWAVETIYESFATIVVLNDPTAPSFVQGQLDFTKAVGAVRKSVGADFVQSI